MDMRHVCAVVVTYNRKALLAECVGALLKSWDVRVLIVDNASTDGTREHLRGKGLLDDPRVGYVRLARNEGGAGGFYWGLRLAYERGADGVWLMDDDVLPLPGSLEALRDGMVRTGAGFACSTVREADGVTSANIPVIADRAPRGLSPSWDEWLDEGIVKVAAATFVSVLIGREAIARCGFPYRRFFIWYDDTEYTMRIVGAGFTGIMVGKSRVLHVRPQASILSLGVETETRRIRMFHYHYRNRIWTLRHNKRWGKIVTLMPFVALDALNILTKAEDRRIMRLWALARGMAEGFFSRLDNHDEAWRVADAVESRQGWIADAADESRAAAG